MTERRIEPQQPSLETSARPAGAALGDLETFIVRGTREFRLTNVALFAAGFSTFALLYCVQPIMPVFSSEFHVAPATASLSLSVTTQSLAFAMLVASALSEVFGRKRVMVISLVASALLTVAAAFAPSWTALLVLRALAGIAFSGLPATAMAYVGEEMDVRSLGLAMGLYIGGTGLGALGGRLIVGVMTDVWSWRAGLLTIGLLGALSAAVFAATLPASRHFSPRTLAVRALLSSFGHHLADPLLRLLFLQGFLLLGVFVAAYNYIGYRLMAPPYGFSQTVVGLIFMISLVGIVSAAWTSDLASRLGRGRVFWVLVVLVLGGVTTTLASTLWLVLAGMTLLTFAFYGAHAVASSWVGSEAREAKAQAASLYLFSYYTGSSVFGSVGGLAWQWRGWPGVVLMSIGLLVLALLGARRLARTERRA